MKVVEVKHPLVKHKLGLMREGDISTKRFRELATEVGSLLTLEATADVVTGDVRIVGWRGGGAVGAGSVTLIVVSSLLAQWEDTRWSRDAAAGRSLIGARWREAL